MILKPKNRSLRQRRLCLSAERPSPAGSNSTTRRHNPPHAAHSPHTRHVALPPLRFRAAHRSTRIVKPLLHPKNDAKHSYISVFCSHIAPKTDSTPLTYSTKFSILSIIHAHALLLGLLCPETESEVKKWRHQA